MHRFIISLFCLAGLWGCSDSVDTGRDTGAEDASALDSMTEDATVLGDAASDGDSMSLSDAPIDVAEDVGVDAVTDVSVDAPVCDVAGTYDVVWDSDNPSGSPECSLLVMETQTYECTVGQTGPANSNVSCDVGGMTLSGSCVLDSNCDCDLQTANYDVFVATGAGDLRVTARFDLDSDGTPEEYFCFFEISKQ